MKEVEGYGPIVFLSAIDKPRTKNKISKKWFTNSSRVLYKESGKRDIDEWQNDELLRKQGNKYHSIFGESFKKIYQEQKTFNLNQKQLELFADLLDEENVRKVFTLSNVHRFYKGDSKYARENFIEVFDAFLVSMIQYTVESRAEKVAKEIELGPLGEAVRMIKGSAPVVASIANYGSFGKSDIEAIRNPALNMAKDYEGDELFEEFIEEVVIDLVPFAF